MDFFEWLFQVRNEMLQRFPGRSRRKWFDPEDAFSHVTLEAYQKALKRVLASPPDEHDWRGFLYEKMRRKIWQVRRKDSRTLSGDEGSNALAKVEAGEDYDPVRSLEARNELEFLVPEVKGILSPKEGIVFFAAAQELPTKEVAKIAKTTPGATRVLLSRAEKKLDKKLRPKKPEKKSGPKKEVA